MKNRLAQFVRRAIAACRVLALLVLALGLPSLASAEPGDKIDAQVRDRASRISGWSRVIVEFVSEPDVRAFGRGTAGRKLGARSQVAEIENTSLNTLASDARVSHIWLDRPTFATLERTGGAIGSTLARDEFGLSGRGVGVAVVD